jgi:hypothetical protein
MTILQDETPKAEAPMAVNTKALWEAMWAVTKGAQWKALSIAVLMLNKGSTAKTIRERLKKQGISWGSKIVTMAANIRDGASLGDDAMKPILAMPTDEAITATLAAIEAHSEKLHAKAFDTYYKVCGEAEYNDKVKRILANAKADKAKAKAEKDGEPSGDAEPSADAEPAEPAEPMATPLEHAIAAVTAILADGEALAAFAEWFAGVDGIASEPEAEPMAEAA